MSHLDTPQGGGDEFVEFRLLAQDRDVLRNNGVDQLVTNPDDRKVVDLLLSGTLLGRPLATTPGVPEERVKALRDAFDAVMKDPDFIKEVEAAHIEIDPVRGQDMQ